MTRDTTFSPCDCCRRASRVLAVVSTVPFKIAIDLMPATVGTVPLNTHPVTEADNQIASFPKNSESQIFIGGQNQNLHFLSGLFGLNFSR